jgi:hypothetical protein
MRRFRIFIGIAIHFEKVVIKREKSNNSLVLALSRRRLDVLGAVKREKGIARERWGRPGEGNVGADHWI